MSSHERLSTNGNQGSRCNKIQQDLVTCLQLLLISEVELLYSIWRQFCSNLLFFSAYSVTIWVGRLLHVLLPIASIMLKPKFCNYKMCLRSITRRRRYAVKFCPFNYGGLGRNFPPFLSYRHSVVMPKRDIPVGNVSGCRQLRRSDTTTPTEFRPLLNPKFNSAEAGDQHNLIYLPCIR